MADSAAEESGGEIDCKICRGPSEPRAPLLSPCKCKGSIGAVHEVCLFDWLTVNNRTTEKCEVCGTPFKFQKVYRQVPSHLPASLVLKQIARTALWALTWVLRCLLVVVCWTAALPWATLWTFRFFFYSGSSFVYVLTGFKPRPSPASEHASSASTSERQRMLSEVLEKALSKGGYSFTVQHSGDKNETTIDMSGQHNGTDSSWGNYLWHTAGKDIVSGQIIVCVAVVVFLAFFLLREWITQQQPPLQEPEDAVEEPPVPEDIPALEPVPQPEPDRLQNADDRLFDLMLESRDNGVSKEEFRQLVLGASQSYIESYYDGNNVGLAPLDANGLSQDLLDVIEVRTRNLINQTAATRRDAETKLENEEEKVVGSVGSEQSVANSSSTAILPENISLPSSPTLSDEGDSDSVDSVSLGQHTTFSKDPNGQLSTSQSGIPPVEETFEETSDGGDHESDYHTDAGELESSGSDPGSLSELRPGLENSIRAIVDAQAVDSDDSEASEAEAEAEEEDVDDDWMEVLDPPQDGPDNAAAIAAAAADDADGGLDDFDGILEAVGLRGNLSVLWQTIGLMHVFITIFLALTIWAPFVVGRMTIALNAAYYCFVGPVKVVRTVTDPLVDWSTYAMQLALTKLASPLQPLTSRLPPLPTPAPSSSTESELVTRLLQHIEPYSTLGLALARKTWTNMCTQDSAVDRAFVIALGYLTIGVVSALWCYRESQLERPWSRRIQRHIENAGLLLKVAMFILVELIAFPIVCGACIDIVSLPLWKDASLNSRIVFQLSAPYSSTFFHWAAGTIFMFVVAQWIALCRSTVRKGALFFVRDPRDPDAHPIKEMTEQSVKVQFTKLSKSVLLYAALMLVFFTATRFLQVVHPRFLPLRWFASQSFSALPLDLVFALAILPSTVNMLRPVRTIRIIFGDWTKVVAHHLRLSSFLLGNRDMSEEGSFAWRSWKDAFTLGMLRSGDDSDSARVWTASGSLARAPGVDHIKLIPDRPATIAVDAEGHALNKEGEEGIELQRAHGLSDEDFATVYIPPHFRPRLMLAMYLLWAAAALFAITSMVLPLLIGRAVISFALGTEAHDGYAFLFGAYITWPFTWFFTKQIRRNRSGRRRKARQHDPSTSLSPASTPQHSKLSAMVRKMQWPNRQTICICLQDLRHSTQELHSHLRAKTATLISALCFGVFGVVLVPLVTGMFSSLMFSAITTPVNQLPTLWMPMLWCWGFGLIAFKYGVGMTLLNDEDSRQAIADFAEWPASLSSEAYFSRLNRNHVFPLLRRASMQLLWPILFSLADAILDEYAKTSFGLDDGLHLYLPRSMIFKLSFPLFQLYAKRSRVSQAWSTLSSKWLDALKDREFLIQRRVLNWTDDDTDQQPSTVVLPADSSETDSTDGQ